jgi:16S rRNA (cytosine967-C5)-methyltransferase
VVAAYQIFFTRVPAFAAVSEAVDSVRSQRGEKVAAFANAVLRKLAERAQSVGDDERREGLISSMPEWLRGALDRALTPSQARSFLESGGEAPPVALRVEHAQDRDEHIAQGSFEQGRVSPLAILARGAGKPQSLPGWAEGLLSVQEEGSQLAGLALGALPGEEVLDACAGRGNKSAILVRAVGARGAVDVCDKSATKLDRLGEELRRLGLSARTALAVDWTVGSGDVEGAYDRVLVDAPCSGIGTLRRRPEIMLRRRPPDLAAIARAQVAIVSRAALHVRPGGVLVYVVCSVLREEGEDVADALRVACPELEPMQFDVPPVRSLFGEAPSFRLLPHLHGTDGYFAAKFVRRAPA